MSCAVTSLKKVDDGKSGLFCFFFFFKFKDLCLCVPPFVELALVTPMVWFDRALTPPTGCQKEI